MLVDDDEVGAFNLPDPTRHLAMSSYAFRYGGGSPGVQTAVLVSRSLNFDEMNRAWDEWVDMSNLPARATVESRLASTDYKVEIAVIAAR